MSDGELTALAPQFDSLLAIGLIDLDPSDLDLKRNNVATTAEDIDALMAERNAARAARDFATSDELRGRLANLGVIVEDHPDATSSWRWA